MAAELDEVRCLKLREFNNIYRFQQFKKVKGKRET